MPRSEERRHYVQIAVEIATKLGLLAIVLYISYLIVKPFLPLILWGVILAVAISPLIDRLVSKFGHRKKIIIAVTTLLILALVIPTWLFSDSLMSSGQTLLTSVDKKELAIPAPSDHVKDWPVIGEKVHELWAKAHDDLAKVIKPFHDLISKGILWMVGMLKSVIGTIVLTIAAIVIAAAFLISKDRAVLLYHRIMRRLVGEEHGDEWATLSALTVRSVAIGVVGVAVIQSFLALVGMIFMGVPLAAVWALLIMFLTIIQLPALLVIAPVIFYAYTVSSGTSATIFAVYMLIVAEVPLETV